MLPVPAPVAVAAETGDEDLLLKQLAIQLEGAKALQNQPGLPLEFKQAQRISESKEMQKHHQRPAS